MAPAPLTSAPPQTAGLHAGGRRVAPGIWWLSPAGAVLLVVPATLGFAAGYSQDDYLAYFRSAKTLTSGTAVLFALGAACLVAGALLSAAGRRPLPRTGRWPWLTPVQVGVLQRTSTVLFRATMLGYVSFVVAAARNGVRPGDVVQVLLAQDLSSGELEDTIGTVPGVTTLTQVGVAYAVVATLLLLHGRDRRTVLRLAALLACTVLRTFVFTERLALVEVVVPVMALLVVRASQTASPWRRLLLQLAPIPLVLLLLAGFAATEYSRSYQFFKTRTDDGLLLFSAKRLSGYYATAYNNGEILLDHDDRPGRLPYTTVEALWTAPVVEQLDVYDRLVGQDSAERNTQYLFMYGNPEFNNPGGIPAPFVDFGRAGGLVFWLAAGLVTGLAYRAFTDGRLTAVLLYPPVVTGLLELPRFIYWTLGRTVPTVLALLMVAAAVNRSARYVPRIPA